MSEVISEPIDLEDETFTLGYLKNKVANVDRWLMPNLAAVYAKKGSQTLIALMEKGFYRTTDGIEHPIQVLRHEGKPPKISGRSLVEYLEADRVRAGSGSGKNKATKNFVVTMKRERIAEITAFLVANECVIVDPSVAVKLGKERKEAAKKLAETVVSLPPAPIPAQ